MRRKPSKEKIYSSSNSQICNSHVLFPAIILTWSALCFFLFLQAFQLLFSSEPGLPAYHQRNQQTVSQPPIIAVPWPNFGETIYGEKPQPMLIDEYLKKCPQKCTAAYTINDIRSANAIVFQGTHKSWYAVKYFKRTFFDLAMATIRPDQLKIYHDKEKPLDLDYKLRSLDLGIWRQSPPRFFNLTMTMFGEADFRLSNAGEWSSAPEWVAEGRDWAAEKTKTAAVVLRAEVNCSMESRADLLIAALRKHVNIDVLGRCNNSKSGTKPPEPEYDLSPYKFLFVIEQSFCQDYLTPTIYEALHSSVVPIFFAHLPNPDLHLPTESYIDLRAFKTVQSVAEMVKRVVSDHNLYNSFFKWRSIHNSWPQTVPVENAWCSLCSRLHSPAPFPSKSIEKINDIFIEAPPSKWCKEPGDYELMRNVFVDFGCSGNVTLCRRNLPYVPFY